MRFKLSIVRKIGGPSENLAVQIEILALTLLSPEKAKALALKGRAPPEPAVA